MKHFISIMVILIFSQGTVNSQVKGGDEKFQKLFDLYVMEKYEDCAYKAESFTLKDKTRNAPEPYLYMAMCYYEMSKDPEMEEAYPKAYKESIKYASKFLKKDKEGTIYNENLEFFVKLKKLIIAKAKENLAVGEFRKASGEFRNILKIEPENYDVMFIKGVCDILAKNLGEGSLALRTCMPKLIEGYNHPSYKPDEVTEPLIVDGMILYSDYLKENDQADSAKATITYATTFFPGNGDIQSQASKINGN